MEVVVTTGAIRRGGDLHHVMLEIGMVLVMDDGA